MSSAGHCGVRSSLGSVSVVPAAGALACSVNARFRLAARTEARTAVELVPEQVDATIASAPGKPGSAPWVKAHPLAVAIRRRVRADVSAGATVVGIQAQECARPVAVDGTLDTVVDALTGDACGVFVDAGTRPAVVGTGTAIVHVV